MRKWTKGFLIFGVVTSIIGFSMMIIGIQTDGVRSLLAMSQNPVFESRMEELVFDQDIENLNISLTEHSLVITESNDDKIHIQYHPTISEKENLQHSIKEKSLEITDTKSTTRRSIGSSIEGILYIASGISSRNDEVVLSLPRGKDLKNLTAQVNHRILSIANAKLSNAKILSRKDISLELSQKELDRINVEFSAEHGDIYRWHRDRRDIPTGGSKGEALANPYKTEKKDTQDLLVAKSNQSIYFP